MAMQKQFADVYVSLIIIGLGLVSFAAVLLVPKNQTHQPSQPQKGGSIQILRTQAIEQALKDGRNEYVFTVENLPLPIGP